MIFGIVVPGVALGILVADSFVFFRRCRELEEKCDELLERIERLSGV